MMHAAFAVQHADMLSMEAMEMQAYLHIDR